MSMMFTVRQATIEDLNPLADVFNRYRVFYKQASNLEGAKLFLSERLKLEESVIYIAVDNGTDAIIAFTQLYPTFSSISMRRAWTLNDLYVAEHYRGQGIAQLLLDQAKLLAKETKSKGLSLSTAVDNEVAQKLYERNGFVKDDEFYYYDLQV